MAVKWIEPCALRDRPARIHMDWIDRFAVGPGLAVKWILALRAPRQARECPYGLD